MNSATSGIISSIAEKTNSNLLSQMNGNRASSSDNTLEYFPSVSPNDVVCTKNVQETSDGYEEMITKNYSFSEINATLFAEAEVTATEIVLMMLSELKNNTKSQGKPSFSLLL